MVHSSAVWVRRSAIRPIVSYARVPQGAVAAVAARITSGEGLSGRKLLDEGKRRFDQTQPELSSYLASQLSPNLDPQALALGQMLSSCIFLMFEAAHPVAKSELSRDAVLAVEAALGADEELRRADPVDPLDTEDIVAIEQPSLVSFVNQHVGSTLEEHSEDINVDDVGVVFRVLLIQILALSEAVCPPLGHPGGRLREPMA